MVSPASPEKARTVLGLRVRVLSSVALRMVAPRVAVLEAARSVKSRPVRAMRTSLFDKFSERPVWGLRSPQGGESLKQREGRLTF